MSEVPTLYEWAGGAAIERMINCFYDRIERDDLLSPFFPGGVSDEHREHVTTWWCEVFGGPAGYTDQFGGYAAMLAHHRDLGITAEHRFRFASLMSLAADDAACRRTRSSGPHWSATWSGAPGWPWTTPSPGPTSLSGPGASLGLGESPRPTSLDPALPTCRPASCAAKRFFSQPIAVGRCRWQRSALTAHGACAESRPWRARTGSGR